MYFERTEENEETTKHTSTNRSFAIYQRCLQQKRGDQLPLHWHDELQIVWVEEGSFVYTIDDEQILLSKNEAIIINSRVLHGAVLASEKSDIAALIFLQALLLTLFLKKRSNN
ncbi:cupin domain-containing protein [Enterococcus casseliflavus]|uniref:cupin domain-containing protein n=1 Tax=Enterococcus casseliflavus TaxID=37734 RepID=UPI003D131170